MDSGERYSDNRARGMSHAGYHTDILSLLQKLLEQLKDRSSRRGGGSDRPQLLAGAMVSFKRLYFLRLGAWAS